MTNEEYVDPTTDLFESSTKIVRGIYIDIPYMMDIYLGALLSTIPNQETYNKVLDNIENYNNRNDLNVLKYFDCKGEEESLTKLIKNGSEKTKQFISLCSPYTDMYTRFHEILDAVTFNNRQMNGGRTEPLHITINTYPLELDSMIKTRWTFVFSKMQHPFTLEFINTSYGLLDRDVFALNEIFCIHDLKELLSIERICKYFYEDKLLEQCKVFAFKQVDDVEDHEYDNTRRLTAQEIVLMEACNATFQFDTPHVLVED